MSPRPPIKRVFGFAALPALSAISPLLMIPSITANLGVGGWTAFAIGQSLGAFGALVINFGWSTLGPAKVAPPGADRMAIYKQSLGMRLLVALPVLPLTVVVAYLLTPADRGTAVAAAAGLAITGLLPTWFFIGTGEANRIAAYDTLPRVAAALGTSGVLFLIPSGWVYGAAMMIAVGVSVARTLSWRGAPNGQEIESGARTFRRHLPLVLSGLVAGAYTSLSVTLVTLASPRSTAVYAGVFRFRDIAWTGLLAVTNSTQGWISEGSSDRRSERRRAAFALNVVCGALGGGCIAVLLPLCDAVVFSGTIDVTGVQAALVGVIALAGSVTMSTTFHFLAPAGRSGTIAISGTVAAVVGLGAVPLGATTGGATGALLGVLVSELVNVVLQLAALRRVPRAG